MKGQSSLKLHHCERDYWGLKRYTVKVLITECDKQCFRTSDYNISNIGIGNKYRLMRMRICRTQEI
jgi:hypothetical protein